MLIRGSRMLIGGGGMLIGGGRTFLCRINAGLGLFVILSDKVAGIFDLLTVLVRLLAHLVHLCLNRSRGIADVFLRGTAAGEQGAGHD